MYFRKQIDSLYRRLTGIRVKDMADECENYTGTHNSLCMLQKSFGYPQIKPENISDVFAGSADEADCTELAGLFKEYGSDKSTKHNYYLAYADILKGKRNAPLKIFEIGLGTNNTNFHCNMGKGGKPGASLRAFRDWAKNSRMFGADIDKDVLFSEERIETLFIDQTDAQIIRDALKRFDDKSFDLFIDDGLHNTHANITTITESLRLIKDDGYLVVEDIAERYLPVWQTVYALLEPKYNCRLLKGTVEYMFIIQPKK